VALGKLCLFTHNRSFISFYPQLFSLSFFHSKHNNVVHEIVLGTSSMSCLTLFRLLDVCKWIFVSILFLVIDTCVKG